MPSSTWIWLRVGARRAAFSLRNAAKRSTRPRRRALATIAAVLMGSAGCASPAETAPAHPGAGPPVHVAVARVTAGPLRRRWVLFGEVRASLRAQLAAGAEGEVRQVFVREGDHVAAGDLLLRVDGSLLQARVDAVRAENARVDHERKQAERERARYDRAGIEVVAGIEIERATSRTLTLDAERASQQAALREATAELQRHVTRAPFSGVVSARHVDPGDWVTVGAPAFELVADHAQEVFVGVPPALLPHLKVGDTAQLHGVDQTATLRIVGIVDALDPATRTAPVRLALEASNASPPAGSTVDVAFEAFVAEPNAFRVPRDALVETATTTKLWVLRVAAPEKTRVREPQPVDATEASPEFLGEAVPVAVLARGVEDVLVRGEGLAVGDRVVVRGNERIRPGQALIVDAR